MAATGRKIRLSLEKMCQGGRQGKEEMAGEDNSR